MDTSKDTAKQIFDALMARLKAGAKAREQVVFDPETGIQKHFLDGKLVAVKIVRGIQK